MCSRIYTIPSQRHMRQRQENRITTSLLFVPSNKIISLFFIRGRCSENGLIANNFLDNETCKELSDNTEYYELNQFRCINVFQMSSLCFSPIQLAGCTHCLDHVLGPISDLLLNLHKLVGEQMTPGTSIIVRFRVSAPVNRAGICTLHSEILAVQLIWTERSSCSKSNLIEEPYLLIRSVNG